MYGLFRLLVALLIIPASMFGAAVVLGIAPASPRVDAAIAMGLLLFGFWALRIVQVPAAPWRPLRASVLLGGGIAVLLLIAGLPFQLNGPDALTAAFWTLTGIGSLAAARLVSSKPRVAVVLITILGVCGLLVCLRFVQIFATLPETWAASPSTTYSAVIAASTGTAWLAAAWHGRHLWTRSSVGIDVAAS